MNAPLRRVISAVLILFGLLFVNLNYVQFVQSDKLRNHPVNRRVIISSYERERGAIVVQGEPIALSKETGERLKYQREYPAGLVYSHIVGYQSLRYGLSGMELTENSVLAGDDDRLFVGRVASLIRGQKERGGNVVLTLEHQVQQTAFQALKGRKGAVVALNPSTGEILAAVSAPSFDPNPLASHEDQPQQEAWRQISQNPDKPLLNRALRESYPPGSAYKVVMTAALLAKGYTPERLVPAPTTYTPPQTTRSIHNFGGRPCGNGRESTLLNALTVSCNTPFAKLGVEQLGADAIRAQAKAFGFETEKQSVPLPVARSQIGALEDPPAIAQSSIGQRDVRMTPLQGAMIAAAVANGGKLMRPYLVKEIQAPNYSTLDTVEPETFSTPLTVEQAGHLRDMMVNVVERGTGRKAHVSGVQVGGKTGTAEDGDERQDHEWFIGFAIANGEPIAAVAVVLENAGTSSADAAEIAGAVMRSAVVERGQR